MTLALSDLVSSVEPSDVTASELAAAQALELDTTTWQPGDPSRTLMAIFAQLMSTWSKVAVRAIKGGLLDYADGGWLTLLARNAYGVERLVATRATCTVRLTNAGGGVYTIASGDLTFSDSATGQTYRNSSGGTLNASSTLDVSVFAEAAGSAGSAGVGEIDTLVSPTLIAVTCASTTTGVGSDDETDAALRLRCRDSLAALSPDGAAAAYAYVARSALRVDGTPIGITRVRVTAADGVVSVTLADPDGPPEVADVTRVDDLIQTQVVPLGVTCDVAGASALVVPVTYTAFVGTGTHASDTEIKAAVATALEAYFTTIPIGGWPTAAPGVGALYTSDISSVIDNSSADIFRVTLALPASDVAPAADEVAVLGTVTGTITRWDP